MTANMKLLGWGRSIRASSLRGLQSRSATGQNGQAAAKKEVSAGWSGGWMPENISGVPAGKSVFHLTSPFIGLPSSPITRELMCDAFDGGYIIARMTLNLW